QRLEAVQRRGPEDRLELRQVLAHDEVRRYGERRLVGLAAHERRAIRLCEERQSEADDEEDRKSTRLNCSHLGISTAVFCLKKKKKKKKKKTTIKKNKFNFKKRNNIIICLSKSIHCNGTH